MSDIRVETKTYIAINFEDGGTCIVENSEELEAMTEGYEPSEYTASEIEMTKAEFEALPEFEG